MSPANLVFHPDHKHDPRPLVELIVEQLGGYMRYIDKYNGRLYVIEDWIHVITGNRSRDRGQQAWKQLQDGLAPEGVLSPGNIQITSVSTRDLNPSSGNRMVDTCYENGLYYITQHMPSNDTVLEVRKYLAAAGVIVDTIRREPSTGVDFAREAYRMQGKNDEWIDARLDGKIKRVEFTNALDAAVAMVLEGKHYAIATNDIYLGLWNRTAKFLKEEMKLPKKANLRDHQGTLALLYQSIAEQVCAEDLGEKTDLTWNEAQSIVKRIATMIGKQAKETGEILGKDLATGKPLLRE